jgi:hypothetical protein
LPSQCAIDLTLYGRRAGIPIQGLLAKIKLLL